MTYIGPKIVGLDIETSPALVYTYGLFNQNIGIHQIVENPRITCFSWQNYGEKKVNFASEYHDGRQGMLEKLYQVRNSNDIFIGYNSRRFDLPWIDGELLEAGFEIAPKALHIDLLSVFRANTKYISKKLDYVSQLMLQDKKIDVNTLKLTLECFSDDEKVSAKAWALMKRYSIKDTALLFPIFEIVKPWVKMPAPINVFDLDSCPRCGSVNLVKRGFSYSTTGASQRWRCSDCKGYLTGAKVTGKRSLKQ